MVPFTSKLVRRIVRKCSRTCAVLRDHNHTRLTRATLLERLTSGCLQGQREVIPKRQVHRHVATNATGVPRCAFVLEQQQTTRSSLHQAAHGCISSRVTGERQLVIISRRAFHHDVGVKRRNTREG